MDCGYAALRRDPLGGGLHLIRKSGCAGFLFSPYTELKQVLDCGYAALRRDPLGGAYTSSENPAAPAFCFHPILSSSKLGSVLGENKNGLSAIFG
jgi:hypothetical protein